MSEKFIQVVFSNPVEGRDAEFNDWYDNVRIPELLAVPGMLSAKRPGPTGGSQNVCVR